LFQAALDDAALVVVGRLGHERHPNPGRHRLVPTSRVARLEADPGDGQAHLWNPAALGIAEVLADLGVVSGTVAVTGGRRVFDLFLPHYTGFRLSEANALVIRGGIPAFTAGHPRAVLAGAGHLPSRFEPLDV